MNTKWKITLFPSQLFRLLNPFCLNANNDETEHFFRKRGGRGPGWCSKAKIDKYMFIVIIIRILTEYRMHFINILHKCTLHTWHTLNTAERFRNWVDGEWISYRNRWCLFNFLSNVLANGFQWEGDFWMNSNENSFSIERRDDHFPLSLPSSGVRSSNSLVSSFGSSDQYRFELHCIWLRKCIPVLDNNLMASGARL